MPHPDRPPGLLAFLLVADVLAAEGSGHLSLIFAVSVRG